MTETIGAAVATRAEAGPGALVKQYQKDFSDVLPTHVKPEQWIRVAQGALKTGKKTNGRQFDLEVAAMNDPGAFLGALRTAAMLGLTPGSEEFYLTPRRIKGQAVIQGIVGYQGYIELMYRAGAVSSVVVENVFAKDGFQYTPGVDERPVHHIDWDLDDRGALRLVYAYARMKDGATSKVVVLNRAEIAKIRAKSDGANSEYSPWNTNEPAMWMKSAARQLRKWVPTSSEYITTQLRAAKEADKPVDLPPAMSSVHIPDEEEVVEAELVMEPTP